MTKTQADAAVFPDPSLLRDCGIDLFCPSVEGLTEQWPDAGHTQECSQDCTAAAGRRLRPGASPPQKKFARQCSSSVSGSMANHNTHLAPGFTPRDFVAAPANVVVLWGLLGSLLWWELYSLYQMSSQRGNRLSPVV